jgi:hypothetical protein
VTNQSNTICLSVSQKRCRDTEKNKKIKHFAMKKVLFSLFVILVLFVSCTQQPVPQKVTTSVTNEKFTYSDQGFYVEQQVVVSGNTVWGISEKVYGTGMQWRDIVALNPFLNTPDRLYYNPDRKMWIVRIYPGEVLNIGGKRVYPSVSYERTTTITTTEPGQASTISVSDMPWWGWLVIIVVIALLIWLFGFYRSNSSSSSYSSSSSAIHVNASNDCDIDIATRAAIIGHDQDFENRISNILDRSSRKHGRLMSFVVDKNSDGFYTKAKFSERYHRNGDVKVTVEKANGDKEKS